MKRTTVAKWSDKYSYWKINVQKDGVRKSFYSSTPGKKGQRECHEKADAWLDGNIQDTNQRIALLYEQYIAEKKLTTSKSNWAKLEGYGKNWIIPAIGHRKISSITENDFQQIINKMYADGKAKKTLLCLRATITEFCKYCRRIRVTTLNPEFLTIPNGAPVKEKNILQKEHIAILFSSDKTELYGREVQDPLINAYRFQVLTGLRPGELLGLRWDDVRGDVIYIRRSINVYGEETKGKNENAIRSFVLTKPAKATLQNQWQQTGNLDQVFPDIPEGTYRKHLQKYCQYNGLPKITPYMLRHTFVSIVKKLPIGMIKPLVGHSQNMDTLGIYGHTLTDDAQETAHEVGQLFTDILQSEVKGVVKA